MKYNRYGDDFLIDKIQPDDLGKELLNVGELAADDDQSSRGIQQYATLNNGHQSFLDVDGQGESNAPDILLPGIQREEDVASSLRQRSDQETAGIERAIAEEHCASTNETAQEI